MRQASRMAGVDVDLDAHSGAQGRQVLVAGVDAHAHRDALHDLDPVAAGVLRRQQREFLRRSRAYARDDAMPYRVRIGVDGDGDLLSGPDIGQLRFLWVGVHPDVVCIDEIEGSCRSGQIFTRRDRRHVRDGAGERRPDDGVVELARRFGALRHRLEITWILGDRPVGIAVELGRDRAELLIEGEKLLLRVLLVEARLIVGRLRRHMGAQKRLLAVEFGVVVGDVVLRLFDLRL
jgi:hypothetical protein